MEILAPAGNKESFLAAIEAGADSIYLGLKDFNTRKRAGNFNFYDLEVLLDYAHNYSVKIFLVMNVLIKHEEMNEAINFISKAASLGIDAVIVQDLGLAHILNKYLPEITLQASTQLACHNSAGAKFLADFAFKRVVLARELTFAEIKSIPKAYKHIEYEIFVHGALCFSISGLCLFSSVIGGFSGNRGLCTQPCRRIWDSEEAGSGYLFSPRDLELLSFLEKIEKTGIISLKIEGRMRSSQYVYEVVSSYKTTKKSPQDLAREKTSCLLNARDEKLFEAEKAQTLGLKIGQVLKVSGDFINFETIDKINLGDKLRIVNVKGDKSYSLKLKEDNFREVSTGLYGISGENKEISIGDLIYLISKSSFNEKLLSKKIDKIYSEYQKANNASINFIEMNNSYTSLISHLSNKTPLFREKLFIKFNDFFWLEILENNELIKSFILKNWIYR